MKVVRRGDEHDGHGDMLPVGTGVDGVFIELEVSDIADHSSAVHARVVLMEVGCATDEGGNGFEPLVDGGH